MHKKNKQDNGGSTTALFVLRNNRFLEAPGAGKDARYGFGVAVGVTAGVDDGGPPGEGVGVLFKLML